MTYPWNNRNQHFCSAPPVLRWAHSPTKPKSVVESCCWWVSKEYLQNSRSISYHYYFSLLLTVDGRNPAPVGSLSHYLQGFIHPWLFGISSINSTNPMIITAFSFPPETEAVLAARILVDIPPVPRPLPGSFVSTLRASGFFLANAGTTWDERPQWSFLICVIRVFCTWYISYDMTKFLVGF